MVRREGIGPGTLMGNGATTTARQASVTVILQDTRPRRMRQDTCPCRARQDTRRSTAVATLIHSIIVSIHHHHTIPMDHLLIPMDHFRAVRRTRTTMNTDRRRRLTWTTGMCTIQRSIIQDVPVAQFAQQHRRQDLRELMGTSEGLGVALFSLSRSIIYRIVLVSFLYIPLISLLISI